MMAPLIAAFVTLVPLIKNWSHDEPVLEKVFDIARDITGETELFNSWGALQKNPELLQAFQQRVMEIELEKQRVALDDRHSARQRDMTLVQVGRTNLRADIMVLAAALGLLACLLAIIYFGDRMPGEAVGIISTISGIFGSCLKDSYTFEFGSSRGSKEKDSTVAALIDKYK